METPGGGPMTLSPRQQSSSSSTAYRSSNNHIHDRHARPDLSPTPPPHAMRYRDRSPGQDSNSSQRQIDARRVPGQLAERARMLPVHHNNMGSVSPNPSHMQPSSGRREDSVVMHERETSYHDERSKSENNHLTTATTSATGGSAESWPDEEGEEASLGSLLDPKGSSSSLAATAQVKRKPKAEPLQDNNKRPSSSTATTTKVIKTDEAEVPAEKVKGKRGRKPKVKESPLDSPATAGTPMEASSPTKARASDPATVAKMSQPGVKRQRAMDDPNNNKGPGGGSSNGFDALTRVPGAAEGYGSESELEDFSQSKEMMSYRLEVHKRGQKVQKAYEAQSTVRRKL